MSSIPRDESVLGFDLRSNNATMNSGKKALLLPSVGAKSELSGAMSCLNCCMQIVYVPREKMFG